MDICFSDLGVCVSVCVCVCERGGRGTDWTLCCPHSAGPEQVNKSVSGREPPTLVCLSVTWRTQDSTACQAPPGLSDAAGLEWVPRICISSKSPSDTAAGLGLVGACASGEW